MRISKYLAVFLITLLLGLAFGREYLSSSQAKPRIDLNPVPLEIVNGVTIERCRLGAPLDSPADDPRCYELQERLHAAVLNGELDGIRNALKGGANVNGRYYQSYHPLTVAASSGNSEAVKLLLENGADVDRLENWGTSPLQRAVLDRHTEVARILLENGADICHRANWDDRNLPNPTALDIARKYGDQEAVGLLESYGARECSQ